jgi:hypothetical protein
MSKRKADAAGPLVFWIIIDGALAEASCDGEAKYRDQQDFDSARAKSLASILGIRHPVFANLDNADGRSVGGSRW